MHKSIVALLLAAFAVLALPATRLMATVIQPIGLAPGSQYQLIFVTAGNRNALSSNIADYNAFVQAEADLNSSLPAATWNAVARTAAVEANVNAPSIGLPVFNMQGQLVAAAGLYTPTLVNPIRFNQFGDPAPDDRAQVWTGMKGFATSADYPLGSPIAWVGNYKANTYWEHTTSLQMFYDSPGQGYLTVTTGGTQQGVAQNRSTDLPFYALSSPITVPTPEPATFVLLMSGLMLVAGHQLLRWRRGATG